MFDQSGSGFANLGWGHRRRQHVDGLLATEDGETVSAEHADVDAIRRPVLADRQD